MIRFDILSIFPRYFDSALSESLLGRASARGIVKVVVHDIRASATDPHHKVDDEPYGGGPGMVMMAPVVADAIESASASDPEAARVVLLTPGGERFDHAIALEMATWPRIMLVCGRYEGVDHRLVEAGMFTREISIGDYVTSGGEVAALVVIEAVSRLTPGFVKEFESVENDSFFTGLLDFPHYTRPREWRGRTVPEVLTSGHHEEIERWRRRRAEELTRERRPDLLGRRPL